jgi:hypothetical protein
MRDSLKWAILGLCGVFTGFVVLLIGFVLGRANTISAESLVLSVVRERVDASTGPFMCILDEMGNVRRYLSREGIQIDKFDNLRTIDDENMLVVFDGREVTAVRFTTFGYRFGEEKCSRIDS